MAAVVSTAAAFVKCQLLLLLSFDSFWCGQPHAAVPDVDALVGTVAAAVRS